MKQRNLELSLAQSALASVISYEPAVVSLILKWLRMDMDLSMGRRSRGPLGRLRLALIEFLCSFAHNSEFANGLVQSRLLSGCIDCMFWWPWHNVLHAVVTRAVVQILRSGHSDNCIDLIQGCRLVDRLCAAQTNMAHVDFSGARPGYSGHVFDMCNEIVKLTFLNDLVREMLTTDTQWQWLVGNDLLASNALSRGDWDAFQHVQHVTTVLGEFAPRCTLCAECGRFAADSSVNHCVVIGGDVPEKGEASNSKALSRGTKKQGMSYVRALKLQTRQMAHPSSFLLAAILPSKLGAVPWDQGRLVSRSAILDESVLCLKELQEGFGKRTLASRDKSHVRFPKLAAAVALSISENDGHGIKRLLQNYPGLLQYMLAQSAKTAHQNTPVHDACHYGAPASVQALINAGRRFSIRPRVGRVRNAAGETPLHIAARVSSMSAMDACLTGGADLLADDKQGRIPLDLVPESTQAFDFLNKLTTDFAVVRQLRAAAVPLCIHGLTARCCQDGRPYRIINGRTFGTRETMEKNEVNTKPEIVMDMVYQKEISGEAGRCSTAACDRHGQSLTTVL